jgi:hypothetical protein
VAWTCNTCRVDVPLDTEGCPSCGALKAAWTVVTDKTRTFAIELKKWELWRGEGDEPVAPDDPAVQPATMPVAEAEEALALPREAVASLAARGLLPAPRHLLVVRVFPRADKKTTAVVTVLYTQQESVEHELTSDAPPLTDGRFDLLYAFVFGEGEPPVLPGVQVIDITDADAASGHAPHVHVTGLHKKKPRELPVRAVAAPRKRFIFSR